MQKTPQSNRLHIAIFGRRNAGKSSLINALTNQDLAIVSPIAGTTADPVYKAMEIPPIGPVVLIDTAGLDDFGELGERRVKKSKEVLNKADLILLVVDARVGLGALEFQFIKEVLDKDLPIIGVINKIDLIPEGKDIDYEEANMPWVKISIEKGWALDELKDAIIKWAPRQWSPFAIAADLIDAGELALLVVCIDSSAPKGRLILPQVQTIRDLLDQGRLVMVTKVEDLKGAFEASLHPPAIVITDSQLFAEVAALTPLEVPLTSFSILFARYKGDLAALVEGAMAIKRLKAGDKVLIAEACTHHQVDDDIGTVKIPRLLQKYVGGILDFTWVSGGTIPEDLTNYDLFVHCGACMINQKEMLSRIAIARSAGVPIVNYGVLLAFVIGILQRALAPFPEVLNLWKDHEWNG